jgi:hypothetical protein
VDRCRNRWNSTKSDVTRRDPLKCCPFGPAVSENSLRSSKETDGHEPRLGIAFASDLSLFVIEAIANRDNQHVIRSAHRCALTFVPRLVGR